MDSVSMLEDVDGLDRPQNGRLLLVTAVRLREGQNGLQIDDQTFAGLRRWAEQFREVVFAGILLAGGQEEETSANWVDVASLPCISQVRFIALPMAYRVGAFVRTYRTCRRLLADEIRQADHLCFTIGYLVGDWAAIAALEAMVQGRKYGVWFDRVEHEVLARTVGKLPLKRQIKERASLLALRPYHHYLTRHSSLALLQGMDTFGAYAPHASNPACVYDVHTGPEDFATAADLAVKQGEILAGEPLRIVYAGRAAEMKGPLDWLEAIAAALRAGAMLNATWLGDGPLLPAMRQRVSQLGIEDHVRLRGHVENRTDVLNELRRAHLLLFCHKTPESPRCLIEALVSACPIVGYDSAYARGLIEDGGGHLTPINEVEGLAATLVSLAAHRENLSQMVGKAAEVGQRFEEAKLYRERAALIAAYA